MYYPKEFFIFHSTFFIPSVRTLFLDLASNSTLPDEGACIACVTEKETVAIEFVDHRIGDDGILPLIEKVMEQAGWTHKDLTNIACVNGPGGFTSLRMAVALANTFADQLKLPMAGVHLSDLWNARISKDDKRLEVSDKQLAANSYPLTAIWLHSTKKTQLFIRGGQWNEPTLISLEDLVAQLPEGAHVTGEILPEHRQAIAVKNPVFIESRKIVDTLPRFLSSLEYQDSSITPWYGRGW